MSDPVRYETNGDGLATARLARGRGNALDDATVAALTEAIGRAQRDDAVRGVLLAAEGKLFSPGLDLPTLVAYDRERLSEFMARFGALVLKLYTFPKPVVAAISGHALAGGFILALTADWRVLREGAMVGLNELKVGVPLPYGVTMMLCDRVPAGMRDEVALFGNNFKGEAAVAAGLVHETHDGDAAAFEVRAIERLAQLAEREPQAFATTKRYLRAAAAERMRSDAQFREDFLDSWFAPATQRRITAIVEALSKPKPGSGSGS